MSGCREYDHHHIRLSRKQEAAAKCCFFATARCVSILVEDLSICFPPARSGPEKSTEERKTSLLAWTAHQHRERWGGEFAFLVRFSGKTSFPSILTLIFILVTRRVSRRNTFDLIFSQPVLQLCLFLFFFLLLLRIFPPSAALRLTLCPAQF